MDMKETTKDKIAMGIGLLILIALITLTIWEPDVEAIGTFIYSKFY